jgi:hypothetical protein
MNCCTLVVLVPTTTTSVQLFFTKGFLSFIYTLQISGADNLVRILFIIFPLGKVCPAADSVY